MTLEEFKELKPGDKVKIIDRPIWDEKNVIPGMDKFRGQIMTVSSMLTNETFGLYAIMKEGITKKEGYVNYYCWYPWMIDKKVTEEDSPDGIELLKRENADLKSETVRLKAWLFDCMDKKLRRGGHHWRNEMKEIEIEVLRVNLLGIQFCCNLSPEEMKERKEVAEKKLPYIPDFLGSRLKIQLEDTLFGVDLSPVPCDSKEGYWHYLAFC